MSDYHTSTVGHWIVREHPPTKKAVFLWAGTVLLATCVLVAGISEAADRRGERAIYRGTLGKALPGEGAQEARGSAAQGSRGGGAEAGGPGVVEVCTPNDLDSVRNDLTGSYLQVCDIDLAGYSLTPIGTPAAPFNGTYDGGGFTIANFAYAETGQDSVGLFGRMMMGTVQNVHLENVDVTGWQNVGALVGHMHFSMVQNSSATGTVRALNQWVGGLVGHAHPGSTVSGSWADVAVLGGQKAGGLVGNHHGSVIENSYALGTVDGSLYVGGLAGYLQWDQFPENFLTVIKDSYATGDVVGGGTYRGGLAGYVEADSSEILDSYAEGDLVTPSLYVGGLVGYMLSGNTITNSHATGDIEGSWRLGGLIGYVEGSTIVDSYATGNVTQLPGLNTSYSGGLVGYLTGGGSVVNSYATGNVTAAGAYNGGLVGYLRDESVISTSYATGSVHAVMMDVGGLVGQVTSNGNSLIENSYATGAVSSEETNPQIGDGAGGLVGNFKQGNTMRNSYSTGEVFSVGGRVGGLIGTGPLAPDGVFNSYWDIETSWQATSAGGEGHTTEEMMMQATFVEWDFGGVWNIVEAQTYPWLRWQMPILMHGSGLPGETRPHSGYIDPRAESTDGTTFDLGIEQITLVFSTPVRNIGGASLDASAFEVRVTGGGAVPSIVEVDASANPVIVLELSGLIPLQEWTTVEANVEDMSGNAIVDLGDLGPGMNEPDRVDLGFLPADVDQNGTVTPEDLLRWRTMVYDIEPPTEGIKEDYLDTNRNGLITPFDLLRFRQLVNGIPPATQAWSGESLQSVRP